MNDEQAKTVGLRALAAGFEWKPRCLDGHWDRQVVRSRDDESGDPVLALEWCDDNPRLACLSDRAWPDFRDAATLGVLLAQVCEALSDPGASVVCASYDPGLGRGYRFRVVGGHHHGMGFHAMSERHYDIRAEALVSALEWAKGRAS